MAVVDDPSLVQENIEEYVQDENKIVTCKWLSLMLNLNINAAKRALYTFVENQRKKGDSIAINVTYFVAGLGSTKTGGLVHKCVVVPESHIDDVKSSLSVVTSFHIYSVQKAKLKDYTPLYQTDLDIITQNLDVCSSQSSIKCTWVAQKVVQQPARTEISNNVQKSEKYGLAPIPSSIAKPAAKTTKKAEPRGSIASMFAAAGQNKGVDEAEKSTSAKAMSADKKGGVLSFFNTSGVNKKASPKTYSSKKAVVKTPEKEKQDENTKKTEESDDEPENIRRRRVRTDLFDSSDDENKDEDDELEEDPVRGTFEEDRERPVLVSVDSENEDRKDAHCNIDNYEESPKPLEVIDNEKNPKITVNGGNRKRKRAMKTVTRQYQDEEGFLVSKKEVIWESESEHSDLEEVVPVDENSQNKLNSAPAKQNNQVVINHKVVHKGKTAAKKQSSPQKGKQTSISLFFKKS